MDFGVILTLQALFPNVQIRGCNFHFNQCLWRKIKDIELDNLYRTDEEIRKHIKMHIFYLQTLTKVGCQFRK